MPYSDNQGVTFEFKYLIKLFICIIRCTSENLVFHFKMPKMLYFFLFLYNNSIKFYFSSAESAHIWTQSVFQNYPEGLQCVLAGQKDIEKVMSLYFKPYYSGVFALPQPNYASLPYSLVKWRIGWMDERGLSSFPGLWLVKTTPLWRWRQLIWKGNEFNMSFHNPEETTLWSV